MKQPLFSCVIPVKGARPFFDEALNSLLAQGMGEDLEIIVQDTSEGRWKSEEIRGEREERKGVRWFCESDNGQSDALNKGFAKANGEWLFWLNADDVLLPGALNKVAELIKSSSSNSLNWIAGNQLLINDAGKVVGCSVGNGWHSWLYRNSVPHVYGPSSFFKRELFEKVGGCDTSLNYCMDWDLWIKFMKSGAQYLRVGDYVWAQRQWSGSKTQRSKSKIESDKQWAEIKGMLERNGVKTTLAGTIAVRLWRFFNGNIVRQFVDEAMFCGNNYEKVYA